MHGDRRIEQLGLYRLKSLKSAALIPADQARVATTSAARIAARRRVWLMSPRRPPAEARKEQLSMLGVPQEAGAQRIDHHRGGCTPEMVTSRMRSRGTPLIPSRRASASSMSVCVVLLDLVPASQHQSDLFAANSQRGQKLSPPLMDRYGPLRDRLRHVSPDVRAFKGHAAFPPESQVRSDSPLEGGGFELSVPREIGFVSRPCRLSADLSCGELRAPISEAGCSTTDRPLHPV
jgi:hypothetical protein